MHEYADQENPTKAVMLEETDTHFTVGGYGVVFGRTSKARRSRKTPTSGWIGSRARRRCCISTVKTPKHRKA